MNEIADLQLVFEGKICPYCFSNTEYVDSDCIYGKSYGMIYLCRSCKAWVGVHEGTDKAVGRLANEELREWKKMAHASFDSIWEKEVKKGAIKHEARNSAYQWLANEMNLERERVHIGMFDVDECRQVVEICNKFRGTNEIESEPVVKIFPKAIEIPNDPDLITTKDHQHIQQEASKELIIRWSKNKGINIVELQPHQIRLYAGGKKIDIYPQTRKFHDIILNRRGHYKDLVEFLDSHFLSST